MTASFSHRPATAADGPFLRMLLSEARPELAMLPEPVRDQLVEMQLEAQRRQYLAAAPDSVDEIIEISEGGQVRPVGRVWRHRAPGGHRLLDLAICSHDRSRGIGSAVLEWLCAEAAADGVALNLSVWSTNAGARALYLRHGFTVVEESPDYTELQWSSNK